MDKIKLLKTLTELKINRDNCTVKVVGTSMEPLISDGDMVWLEMSKKYQTGDIIVAIDTRGRILTHRILKITGEALFIKGDNAVALEKVMKENCIGKVVKISKHNGESYLIYYGLRSKLITIFSTMMNRQFTRTKDYKKTMNSIYRKFILRLLKNSNVR